jgi:hypothetical protein
MIDIVYQFRALMEKITEIKEILAKYGLEDEIDLISIDKDLEGSKPENIESTVKGILNKMSFLNADIIQAIISELKKQKEIPTKLIGIEQTRVGKT